MALFSLIFFVILLAVATCIVWALWSAVVALAAKQKVRAILLGLPISIFVVVGIVFGLFVWAARPSTIFKQEFGFAPTPDVVFVNSSTFTLGDSGSAYLQFNASSATIARIVSLNGFTPGEPNFSTNARPTWFTPPAGASQVYSRSGTKNSGGFSSEMRILKVDPVAGQAWYEFSGVD